MKIKICCISTEKEAQMALNYGADVLGLVAQMPSGPGTITDITIAQIVRAIPAETHTFLLTPKTIPEAIVEHQLQTGTNHIQLVDAVKIEDYAALRASMPAVKLVQVIHVLDEASVEEAQRYAEVADYILLDSGNPNLAIKELGGTGRTHNWALSRKIVETIKKPVFLAGGLNAANARAAIEAVQPFGLDICSGVRTNQCLDEAKLNAFFEAVR